jgi:hypothetical protein
VGLATSSNVMALVVLAVISRFDWKREVERAVILVGVIGQMAAGGAREPVQIACGGDSGSANEEKVADGV